ncbi:hypothetical protein VTK26DRAFT_4255 [Humicola hyalothermophila]
MCVTDLPTTLPVRECGDMSQRAGPRRAAATPHARLGDARARVGNGAREENLVKVLSVLVYTTCYRFAIGEDLLPVLATKQQYDALLEAFISYHAAQTKDLLRRWQQWPR